MSRLWWPMTQMATTGTGPRSPGACGQEHWSLPGGALAAGPDLGRERPLHQRPGRRVDRRGPQSPPRCAATAGSTCSTPRTGARPPSGCDPCCGAAIPARRPSGWPDGDRWAILRIRPGDGEPPGVAARGVVVDATRSLGATARMARLVEGFNSLRQPARHRGRHAGRRRDLVGGTHAPPCTCCPTRATSWWSAGVGRAARGRAGGAVRPHPAVLVAARRPRSCAPAGRWWCGPTPSAASATRGSTACPSTIDPAFVGRAAERRAGPAVRRHGRRLRRRRRTLSDERLRLPPRRGRPVRRRPRPGPAGRRRRAGAGATSASSTSSAPRCRAASQIDTALAQLAALTVPRIADWCVVRHDRVGRQPPAAGGRRPRRPEPASGTCSGWRSASPGTWPGSGELGEALAAGRPLIRGSAGVAMLARGSTTRPTGPRSTPRARAASPCSRCTPGGGCWARWRSATGRAGRSPTPTSHWPPPSPAGRRSSSTTPACSTSSPAWPGRCRTACCPPACPTSPASSWGPATGPPARASTWAATSTTPSRPTTTGGSSPSATCAATASRPPPPPASCATRSARPP